LISRRAYGFRRAKPFGSTSNKGAIKISDNY